MLSAAREHTVEQIAGIFGVKRATLYGHLDKATIGGRPRAPKNNPANNRLSEDHGTLSVRTRVDGHHRRGAE